MIRTPAHRLTSVLLTAAATVLPPAAGSASAQAGEAAPAAGMASATPRADSVPVYTLGEVVVLAKRNPVNRALSVHEIGREELESLEIRNVRQALEWVPGIHFSLGSRNEYAFRLRGFEQRQVTVFLDGVQISSPYDGVVDLSQLTGSDLGRVRVSHGASSLLYGANGLGGVVDLTTVAPGRDRRLDVRLEGSSHGRTYGGAEFAGGTDRLQVSGSFALERADAFALPSDFGVTANEDGGDRDNSAFARARFGLRAHAFLTEAHRVALGVSRSDNEYDVPVNALTDFPRYWRFPEWRKTLVTLTTQHELGGWASVRTALYQDAHANLLRSFDDATFTTQERGYAFDSEYDDYSRGINLYPTLSLFPFGVTDAVLMYRRDVHRQRNDADPFERYASDLLTVGFEQDVALSPSVGMVAGANVSRLGPDDAAADPVPAPEPVLQVNGQLAVEYRTAAGASAHVGLARKSRFPTLKELYSSRLGRNVPNPDLRSELALHFEAGVDLEREGWSASLSAFRSELEDLIAYVVVGDGMQQLQNISTARIQGIELDARVRLGASSLAGAYTLARAENTSSGRTSDHLEYRPLHRASARADVRLGQRAGIVAEGRFAGGQHFQDQDTGDWIRLDDQLWVGGRLEYALPGGLRVYTRVDNALDTVHFSQWGVPLPGRELTAGAEVELR